VSSHRSSRMVPVMSEIDEHPTPITNTVVIDPDWAERLLKNNNRNRPLSHPRIARYAKALSENRWHFTGDAIQVDWNEDLLNGQHRLEAVVLSGVSMQVNLVTGLPPVAQRYIDQGRARSAGNQLAIEGMSNHTQIAAIVKIYLAWISGQLTSEAKGVTGATDEIVEYAFANRDDLQVAVTLADRVRTHIAARPGPTGAVAYRARQLDSEAADEFFAELATGANLEIGSPILTYRNHIMKLRTGRVKRTNVEMVFYLVVTWNAWRAGRNDLYRMQLPKNGVTDDKIPEML
jgi:hypothetical protein